jgi:A nuclease of the HNH/ENDO VII superfamily with conserved WHH/SMI1 / KNR4 family (SUKH-1)
MAPASPPGSRYAMRVIHPGSSMLRVRYRQGVLVTPFGAPDWLLYARAMVDVPTPGAQRTADELRVAHVVAANLRMARDGDPLWTDEALTPAGWTWVHAAAERRCALVPVELHGAYRHFGGVTTWLGQLGRGLRTDRDGVPPELVATGSVADDALTELDRHFGYPLPPVYRDFLAATNGAVPAGPGVLPGYGFVVDQPFFGLARPDRLQELWYANAWLRDRFTQRFLAIGYVQGGMLLVGLDGEHADSVWYWDDDDPRADDEDDPDRICGELLHRVADDLESFWSALRPPPPLGAELVDRVTQVQPRLAGACLPVARRAPWQPTTDVTGTDPLIAPFELRG